MLGALSRATERRRAADLRWQQAVRVAVQAGNSTRKVGAVAGCSHTRVSEIVKAGTDERR